MAKVRFFDVLGNKLDVISNNSSRFRVAGRYRMAWEVGVCGCSVIFRR